VKLIAFKTASARGLPRTIYVNPEEVAVVRANGSPYDPVENKSVLVLKSGEAIAVIPWPETAVELLK
jgi:hypothetical protein